MYCPKHFMMQEEELIPFIRQNPFASLVSNNRAQTQVFEPLASQLPFIVNSTKELTEVSLFTHLANSNPQSKMVDGEKVLIIFNGKHRYQTPLEYRDWPAVPTWNYSSVQVHGVIHRLSSEQTRLGLEMMINQFEPELLQREDVMPDVYIDKLLKAITGFRIGKLELSGKNKWGQNKTFVAKQ